MKKLSEKQLQSLAKYNEAWLRQHKLLPVGEVVTVSLNVRKIRPIEVKIVSSAAQKAALDELFSRHPLRLPNMSMRSRNAFNRGNFITTGHLARTFRYHNGEGLGVRNFGKKSAKEVLDFFRALGVSFDQALPLPGPMEREVMKESHLSIIVRFAFPRRSEENQNIDDDFCSVWGTTGSFLNNHDNTIYLANLRKIRPSHDYSGAIIRVLGVIRELGLE